MKKIRTLLALVLALAMALSLFAGCGKQEAETEQPQQEEQQTPAEPEAETQPEEQTEAEPEADPNGTHTVTDTIGQEIELPNTIDRIVIISTMPLASVFCMVEGSGEKLVGLTPESKNAAMTSFLSRIAPEVADVSSDFASGDAVNVEEVATLEPDVVFYNTNNEGDCEAVKQLTELGIPCVGFSTSIDDCNTIETFNAWATLIGEVLQKQVRAQEIVQYGRDVEAMVSERVGTVPEEERKSALILANYTSSAIVAAGSTFGRFWLSAIGADNVALEIETAISPVSLEQIYTWDPDVIFLNSFSAFTADDILNSTAVEGQDWSGLTAVQNGDVYKMPLGVYYWFPPCSDSPLALQWMAKTLYPELFEDLDMDAEIVSYYKNFYGIDLTQEDLDTLYNPPAESAMAT